MLMGGMRLGSLNIRRRTRRAYEWVIALYFLFQAVCGIIVKEPPFVIQRALHNSEYIISIPSGISLRRQHHVRW